MKKILYGLLLVTILAGTFAAAELIQFSKSGGITNVSDTLALPSNPYSSVIVATTAADPDPTATSLAPAMNFVFYEMRLKFSDTASTGTLTISVNANDGATYDHVLLSQNMANVTVDGYLHYQPTRPIVCESGDTIDIAWNPDTASTTTAQFVWGRR